MKQEESKKLLEKLASKQTVSAKVPFIGESNTTINSPMYNTTSEFGKN